MFFYKSYESLEYENIDTACGLYLVRVGDLLFKISASPIPLNKMREDPHTREPAYWPILREQLNPENCAILFNATAQEVDDIINWYDLAFMSPNHDREMTEAKKIYLSPDGKYLVRTSNNEIVEGQIDTTRIDLSDLANKLHNIPLKEKILEATLQAGHTIIKNVMRDNPLTIQEIETAFGFNLTLIHAHHFQWTLAPPVALIKSLMQSFSIENILMNDYIRGVLYNLSSIPTNKNIIIAHIAVTLNEICLVQLLMSSDIETKLYATQSLSNLSINVDNRIAIRVANGIVPLIALLESTEREIVGYAARALSYLALNIDNRIAIKTAKGITLLIALLQVSDNHVLNNAARALAHLSIDADNRDAIREANGIAPLIALLMSNDVEIVRHAVFALALLSLHDENQLAIRKYNGFDPLWVLLSSPDIDTKRDATSMLASLVGVRASQLTIMHHELCEIILTNPFHLSLIKHLVKSDDQNTKIYAVYILKALDAHKSLAPTLTIVGESHKRKRSSSFESFFKESKQAKEDDNKPTVSPDAPSNL